MLCRVAALALLVLILPLTVSAAVEDPDPTFVDVSSAYIRGDSVTVPVSNTSYEPITVVVTVLYDDLEQIYEVQTVVSLAPKQTVMVTNTITDDINPQAQITEGPDPIPLNIVVGTALWGD
jgi:hypothetical protein